MRLVVAFAGILALSTASTTVAAPRVAVVYSSWSSYAFREEFDGHLQSLGWDFEKLENKEVAKWIGRLDEFDVVISAGVGNYENPQDMAPYLDAWLKFLDRGGALLITDASYGSVLDLWMNRLGPDYALTSAGCAPYTRKNAGSAAITCDETSPLLHVPRELPPLLRAKDSLWAHIETWAAGWSSLVTCADNKSLFVARDVGKGTIVVTSYFSFKSELSRPAATALLENLWTHVLGLRSGIVVDSFRVGSALPGPQTASFEVSSNLVTKASLRATLKLAHGESAPAEAAKQELDVDPGGHASFKLPYDVTQRGKLRILIEVTNGEQKAFALEQVQAIPEMITLKVKNRHLYPSAGKLNFSASFAPDTRMKLEDCRGELLIDGKSALKIKPLKLVGDFTVDVSRLPVGRHQATLRLMNRNAEAGSGQFDFYRYAIPRVYSRPDGTTMVDGKPFFPFGWYHVSWSFSSEDRLQCVRDIAAGGFNALHAGIKDVNEWEPFLEEAEKLGVHVVTEFGTDAVKVITRYKDKGAVLAWNPGDEPDGGGVTPDEMTRRFDQFKAADSEHPTYMTLCVPSTYGRYAGCAEVIAPDPYPIPHSPTSAVYTILSAARTEAAKYDRPVWGVLQCFGYPQQQGSWRIPTFAECRNMTYLALLAGVKGILYYTYADNGFKVAEHPDLWADMKTLPAEIKALSPALLDGTLTKIDTGFEDVFAGAWKIGKRTVVCVANTSSKENRALSLQLPRGVLGPAQPMFPGRPAGMTVRDDKLSGQVGPLDVHVYEFVR